MNIQPHANKHFNKLTLTTLTINLLGKINFRNLMYEHIIFVSSVQVDDLRKLLNFNQDLRSEFFDWVAHMKSPYFGA
jgi:hypothetical protein